MSLKSLSLFQDKTIAQFSVTKSKYLNNMNNISRICLSIGLTASAMTLNASPVTVYQLSPANTLVKITEPRKFLILPVQENMPDSKVDILLNGNLARTIYVRLADNNMDYTVPLDLTPYTEKGEVVLNIMSEVDRTHSRDASDFICWDKITTSDAFDTTNREAYRPVYHHTPLYGWMNDPNGMFYKDGVWHLYYQYNPYGSKWQNMSWGHSTSTDLVNWKHEPIAIEPNGLGTIFSGSAVVDTSNTAGFGKDAVIALYTSCGNSQVQSMSYSKDNGKTFSFYPGNPVIPNSSEARDPNMFWHEPTQKWVLVLAHALEKEMQIYTSPNLTDWTLESSFGKGFGAQGGVWECPDLFELPVKGTDESKWVLLCNINPGSPMGGSGTQYFIGDFDGKTFTADTAPEISKWMDFGKDHYATVSWSNAPDNRRTAIGWMSNWQYANEVPTQQFRSANTLPRELGLFQADDGQIYLSSVPSPELKTLRKNERIYKKTTIKRNGRQYAIPELCELVIDYDASTCDSLEFVLSNAEGEEVTMCVNVDKKEFSMDRTKSGITDFSGHFPAVTTAPLFRANAKGCLRIFIDKCSIEVFDSEGRFAMTNLVFPTKPYTTLKVVPVGGKAKIGKLEIYTLNNK